MTNRKRTFASALILFAFAVSFPVKSLRADTISGYDKGEIHVTENGNQISAEYWCYNNSHEWKKCDDLGTFDKVRLQKALDVRRTRNITGVAVQVGGAFDSFAQFFFYANPGAALVGLGIVELGKAVMGDSVPFQLTQAQEAAHQGFSVDSAEDYKNKLKAAITWLQNDKKSAEQNLAVAATSAINIDQVKVLPSEAQPASNASDARAASGAAH